MQTTNGARLMPVLRIEAHDPRMTLDELDDCITSLDGALADAASARLAIEQLQRELERIEASVLLTVNGANADQRRAKLVLTLADDPEHQHIIAQIDATRARLLTAERRVAVVKARSRLLHAALTLLVGGPEP